MVNFFTTKYRANDDFSEPPRRTDSKNPIFIFCRISGPCHLRGPGSVSVGFWAARQLSLLGGGRSSQGALWGHLKHSARAVQLFGRLATVETHTLWYFGHRCSLIVGFDALGIWHFWMFTLFHPFLLFCTISPPHFHHIYSFSRLIDMATHFQGACYGTSYFPPHFSGPLSLWIIVLGIGCSTPAPMACNLLPRWLGRLKTDSSTWNTTPAPRVVPRPLSFPRGGWGTVTWSTQKFSLCGRRVPVVYGEWDTILGTSCILQGYQDGLRVVNWRCKMESISFAIPSSDSPPDCPPSPPPNTPSSSPPKALGPSPLPQEPGRSP